MTALLFELQLTSQTDKLFGFAMKLTGNENDACDLFQETAYKAYKNKEKFQQGTNFKSWVSTIMYNSFINSYRKTRRRNISSTPVEDLAYSLPSSGTIDAYSSINEERIQTAIDNLKPKYKNVFLLHIEGFKYREISEKIGLPIGTVKSRINTARKQLQNNLEEYKTELN